MTIMILAQLHQDILALHSGWVHRQVDRAAAVLQRTQDLPAQGVLGAPAQHLQGTKRLALWLAPLVGDARQHGQVAVRCWTTRLDIAAHRHMHVAWHGVAGGLS